MQFCCVVIQHTHTLCSLTKPAHINQLNGEWELVQTEKRKSLTMCVKALKCAILYPSNVCERNAYDSCIDILWFKRQSLEIMFSNLCGHKDRFTLVLYPNYILKLNWLESKMESKNSQMKPFVVVEPLSHSLSASLYILLSLLLIYIETNLIQMSLSKNCLLWVFNDIDFIPW